jgi:hypothetical protein
MRDKILNKCAQWMNTQEIEQSKTLQYIYYGVCLSIFVSFLEWTKHSNFTITNFKLGNAVPPPYLQNSNFYFLEGLPYGYSQNMMYVLLFCILILGAIQGMRNRWLSAQICLSLCLIWKLLYGYVFTYGLTGNYDLYDMAFAFILVFIPNKEYFSRLAFVIMYFLASSIKIHDGWILANYFNSLQLGAPIFNREMLPLATNLLIIMEMVGGFLLISNHKILHRIGFVYFLIFHIYSGFIVEYRYISITIPLIMALFYSFPEFRLKAISKSTLYGYGFISILILGQLMAMCIEGDQKKTLEGNYYGLFMFEASHQCISTSTIHYKNGTIGKPKVKESHIANSRTDPYHFWYKLNKEVDRDTNIATISWTLDHSINGQPYERIVDEADVKAITYQTFSHNKWIKLDGESKVLDIPVRKIGFINPAKHMIIDLCDPIRAPKLLNFLTKTYWTMWFLTLIIFIGSVGYVTYRKENA